jgi:2-polyprenyl-6-hydroxyphenyl methylase/3-demethylubiquinone-9 3-methyltransferase
MCITKQRALQQVQDPGKMKVLDVGAHWLHSSLLYAMEGAAVTAAELHGSGEFSNNPLVLGVAKEFGIRLVTYGSLSDPVELDNLPESSFDLIIFSEILEHITFNPVALWKSLYRLLSPNGRIIVTTPNCFYSTYIIKDFLRLLSGKSLGITVDEIVGLHTYGHHWKLYSAKDIERYFHILSPDFSIGRIEYFTYTANAKPSILRWIKNIVERRIKMLREGLYAEIVLPKKDRGITAIPGWW